MACPIVVVVVCTNLGHDGHQVARRRVAVEAAVAETGESSMKDMGTVMKAAMARLAGKTADGKAVSEAVKARLS